MSWFKREPPYKICRECGVLFEPHTGSYPDLCQPHYHAKFSAAVKEARYIEYALANMDSLDTAVTEWNKFARPYHFGLPNINGWVKT